MKKRTPKILALIVSAALAAGCVTASYAENTAYGDVNLDGLVDSKDALAVLEHTVGKTVLDDDAFVRADVNGDKEADSSDALDILCYFVGLKEKFDVASEEDNPDDYGTETDMSADEILALYSEAVRKARESRPEYLFENSTQCTAAEISVKDPFGLLKTAGGVSAKEMEESMKEEMLAETNPVKRVMLGGSTNSYVNLPDECTLTDASKLKSIAVSELEDGNYRITIKLSDEKNPSADSTVCKILGVTDYETALEELKKESEVEGAEGLTDVTVDELSYKNAVVVCVLNPETKEIVELNVKADMYMKNTVKIFAVIETVTVKTESTMHNETNYSYFSY